MKNLKSLGILFTAMLFLIPDIPLEAACRNRDNNDREERTLFGANRRRLRREKSDRYRAFNYGNYERPDENGNNEEERYPDENEDYRYYDLTSSSQQPANDRNVCPHCNRRH
jgi:hypothetical protein